MYFSTITGNLDILFYKILQEFYAKTLPNLVWQYVPLKLMKNISPEIYNIIFIKIKVVHLSRVCT